MDDISPCCLVGLNANDEFVSLRKTAKYVARDVAKLNSDFSFTLVKS